MRALALFVLMMCACGGAQGGGPDPCALASKEGPPPSDTNCPTDATAEKTIERLGTRAIPGASGKAMPLGAIAATLWCRGADGEAVGPYRGLDARGRVVRSGQYVDGVPNGAWVAWSASGNVLAVTRYDVDGSLVDEQNCVR